MRVRANAVSGVGVALVGAMIAGGCTSNRHDGDWMWDDSGSSSPGTSSSSTVEPSSGMGDSSSWSAQPSVSSGETSRWSKQSSMGGRVFESPQAAVDALVDAARGRDRAELKQIFGPEVDRLATADKRQDDIDFQRFTGAYEAEHELVGRDGKYVLYVGSGDWWFPAPIVSAGNGWQFDTAAGVDEIINRTVGLNELHVIDSCGAYVRAQEEYFNLDPDGDGSPSYAQKLRSDPGRRNGLYWPDEEGAPMSPLGALVGTAGRAGDIDLEKSAQQPYRGYYFRVLTRQGAGAPGGQMDYVNEDGHMTRGFALIAWPASYGETGVMTFIVSKDGQVYQKDLGEDTDAEARGMAAFDPAGWSVVGDET